LPENGRVALWSGKVRVVELELLVRADHARLFDTFLAEPFRCFGDADGGTRGDVGVDSLLG
jgi:hypothetical protein